MKLISKLFLVGISLFIFQNKTAAFFPNESEFEAFSTKTENATSKNEIQSER